MSEALKNFVYGWSTVFDMFSTEQRTVRFFTNNMEAMRYDWEMVGQDMWHGIREFENEHPELTGNTPELPEEPEAPQIELELVQ